MSPRAEQPTRVLVVGATSAIAGGTIRAFAAAGARLFLAARDPAKLEAVAADLRVRGALQVETAVLDVLDTDHHAALLESAADRLGGLDVVLLAHGSLPDQRRCQESVAETIRALEVNCISAIALLTVAANYFERQRAGCLAVITSVAGDRGRQSNYVYGTAKGALHLFLQGLRNRLHASGVAVVEIKPGFVATPMTAHLKRNALFAEPEAVGRAVQRAIVQRRDVVYVPRFWRPLMLAIRLVPERIFKRLSL